MQCVQLRLIKFSLCRIQTECTQSKCIYHSSFLLNTNKYIANKSCYIAAHGMQLYFRRGHRIVSSIVSSVMFIRGWILWSYMYDCPVNIDVTRWQLRQLEHLKMDIKLMCMTVPGKNVRFGYFVLNWLFELVDVC